MIYSDSTISSSGLVTAISAGTATVTCSSIDGGFTAIATITVNNPGATTYYSTRLSGTSNERYGLAKSISVMPGDIISTEVVVKYLDATTTNWTAALSTFMAAIANGTAPVGTLVDSVAPGSGGSYNSNRFSNLLVTYSLSYL